MTLFVLIFAFMSWTHPEPSQWLGLVAILSLGILNVFLRGWWVGITLADTDAVVHNLRRRRIPWSQIQAVTQESFVGERRVVLWTADKRIPLREPMTYLGLGRRRVDEQYHTIGRWWLAHRGPDWRPRQWAAPPSRSGHGFTRQSNPWTPPPSG